MGLVDKAELGRCIKAARNLGGIVSARELADRLETLGIQISERQLYDYERGVGEKGPSFEVIAGIATITGVDLAFFSARSVKVPAAGYAASSSIARDSGRQLNARILVLRPRSGRHLIPA